MPSTRVLTAAAMAEATTTMMMATIRLGMKVMTRSIRSLIALGPNTLKASWSTKSMSV